MSTLQKIDKLKAEWENELPPNWQDEFSEELQSVVISVPQHVSHIFDPEDRLTEEYLKLTN